MSFVTILCSLNSRWELGELARANGYTVLNPRASPGRIDDHVRAELAAHPDLVLLASTASDLRAVVELDAQAVRYWLLAVGELSSAWQTALPRRPHRTLRSAIGEDGRRLEQLLDDWRERTLPRVDCFHFSFREGVPADADWVIDARFLDSPHWVTELRDLDPEDEAAQRYVTSQPAARVLLDHFTEMLIALLPEYVRQRRTVVRVAVGCTGGRHRSQVITVQLVRRINASGAATARRVATAPAQPAEAAMELFGRVAARVSNGHPADRPDPLGLAKRHEPALQQGIRDRGPRRETR